MASLKSKQSLLHSIKPVGVADREEPPISDLQMPVGVSKAEFERAWTFLAPSVARSGEHTMLSVLAALNKGRRKLWLTDECAVITEIVKYPSGLVVGNMWLGGGSLPAILGLFPQMEEWMRRHGATESRISGRPGWARVTGYKTFRSMTRKELIR